MINLMISSIHSFTKDYPPVIFNFAPCQEAQKIKGLDFFCESRSVNCVARARTVKTSGTHDRQKHWPKIVERNTYYVNFRKARYNPYLVKLKYIVLHLNCTQPLRVFENLLIARDQFFPGLFKIDKIKTKRSNVLKLMVHSPI